VLPVDYSILILMEFEAIVLDLWTVSRVMAWLSMSSAIKGLMIHGADAFASHVLVGDSHYRRFSQWEGNGFLSLGEWDSTEA
jgi:hypothetical protein